MTMNPDLQRERKNATFDVEKVTNMLDGGKDRTERRRYLEEVIRRDPTGIFSNDDNHYLHRTERHVRGIAKGVRLIELCRMLGIGDECGGEIVESKDFQIFLEAVADDIPLGTSQVEDYASYRGMVPPSRLDWTR
jgi:acyl-CoA oxidase